jgi:hypothetical protein
LSLVAIFTDSSAEAFYSATSSDAFLSNISARAIIADTAAEGLSGTFKDVLHAYTYLDALATGSFLRKPMHRCISYKITFPYIPHSNILDALSTDRSFHANHMHRSQDVPFLHATHFLTNIYKVKLVADST